MIRLVEGAAALTATLLLASACLAAPPETRHVVVYHEPGRFAGWPANNGAWSWGDEILVGFTLGHYNADEEGHSLDKDRTWTAPVMLRDDGRTWDLGYARTIVRTDGRLVTVSYYTTAERPEQHLVATIWEPPAP